ncbi:MAG: radical SAM protein, partial [Desulfobacterales bacterium]
MNRSKPPEPHEPAGIYIHIPFCKRKCPYCDFYSVTALDLMQRFVPALKQEMTLAVAELSRFDTVYIGGGTPSLLKAA